MSNDNKKLNAAQRLEALEKSMLLMDKALHEMYKSIEGLRLAGKTLSNKIDSVIETSVQGLPLSEESVEKVMTENNVQELKGRIEKLKASGSLVEGSEIGEMSLIVIREIDPETKKVENPRTQVAFRLLAPTTQELLRGKKVGDLVSLGADKLDVEVTEVYDIVVETQKSE
jgi:hypothetical protein